MAGFGTKTFLKYDDYTTPFEKWESIKKYISNNKIIWSPFYCDGKQKEHFEKMGFEIIHKKEDFFKYTPEYDILIDNPPFGKKREILEKLKLLDKPFILIMPQNTINTSYIKPFDKDMQILIPRRRIQFIKDGITKTNKCNFDCFFYCYKMKLPRDIIWLE